jgi:hypothetical protein
MYVDKLDGRIDAVTYDDISRDWRKEQDRCPREIAAHKDAETSYSAAHDGEGIAPGVFQTVAESEARASEFCTLELGLARWRAHRQIPQTV